MKFAIHILLSVLTPCIAQVTGTLLTSGNLPIAGCNVTMGQAAALSDSTGSFRIFPATTIANPASEAKWSMHDNIFSFTLPVAKKFGFEIFNVRGKKLAEFEPKLLPAGQYS